MLPTVARQSMCTRRISPEGMRSVAQVPSLAIRVTLRMPSGEMRRVHIDCRATVGSIGNSEHANIQWGKAGRMRWKGIRPHNRGVSMNPVDHPMGGGEGRSSGGRHPCTPWGQKTKGLKTRHNKRTEQFIIRRRSK